MMMAPHNGQTSTRRCIVNGWLLLLLAILIFTPQSSTVKAGRFDYRAVALLLCVIALVAQAQ